MEWDGAGKAKVEAVAAAVFALQPILGYRQTDYFQMGNSLKDLKIKLPDDLPPPDLRDLQRRVGAVLAHLLRRVGAWEAEEWPARGGALVGSAETCWQVMGRLVPGEKQFAGRLVEPLLELMRELEASAEAPGRTLLERYGPLAGADPDDPGQGPLVAAGLMSLDEWRQVARRAVPQIPRGPAEVLRSSGALDWMLQS
jgi:hypothetical protein